MTTQSRSLQLADQLASQPYSFPGGYPVFGIFDDGGCCCSKCAKTERSNIASTTGSDGWCLTAVEINWESPDLYCDNCGSRIESAYAD